MRGRRQLHPAVRQNSIADYLPWLCFQPDTGFLVTKSSTLLAFYRLHPHGDYYSPEEDDAVAAMWNRFVMTLPDCVSFWYELQKTPGCEHPDHTDMYTGPADRRIAEIRREEAIEEARGHESQRVLTLSFPLPVTRYGLSDEAMESINKLLVDMEGRFASVKISAERMDYDETCSYLHSCISTRKHDIATPSAASNALSDALWDDDMDVTLVPLKLGSKFVSVISVDDFPDAGTSAEMLSGITSIDGDIRWVTRYTVRAAEEAKKIIDNRRRQYFSRRFSAKDIAASSLFNSSIDMMDSGEVTKYQECELALTDNGNETTFGYYTGLFVYSADTETELKAIGLRIQNVLSKAGFIYRPENLNLFAAWVSSIPGNLEANPRKQFISSGNVACVMSLTAPYQGEYENTLLKSICGCGFPHATGLLPNHALYSLNLNGRGNSGHTFVLGPTGSGKSVLLSFLASRWGKYPGSRVIIFDKGFSSKPLVKANNGAMYFPGMDSTCFQPFKDAAGHIELCMRFLMSIASVNSISLSASEQEEMAETLKLMIPGHESLSVFRDLLQGRNHGSEMVAGLKNYTSGGAWGGLFDADHDTLSPQSWPKMTLIEMGDLMTKGDHAIIPALTYIIGQLDALFEDCRPTLLIMDEAWVYMRHPVFRGFIETWLKTLRKFNVFLILATQEVSDYDAVLGSILTNCHTKIMLPNTNALTGPLAPLYQAIGLTDTEIQIISSGMRPQRDYLVMQEEGNAVVDFAISKRQLEIFSKTPSSP